MVLYYISCYNNLTVDTSNINTVFLIIKDLLIINFYKKYCQFGRTKSQLIYLN